MSDWNEENLKALARLCRIEIQESDLLALSRDLKGVLDYVSQLQEVDVTHVIPYVHVDVQDVGTLRADIVEDTLSRADFLAVAPDQVGGMIRVPPIIKQNP